jgi:hypothetical protein
MLGVLPPVGWRNDGPAESFKLSERTSGSITGIYVRIGDRYFTFKDGITLAHAECCEPREDIESVRCSETRTQLARPPVRWRRHGPAALVTAHRASHPF